MKFLLSILVIIGNLNVLLANNDNCRENDLNALMVRLRVLRTDFDKQKKVLEDQKAEIEDLRQEINNTSSELKEHRQNTSSEIAEIKETVAFNVIDAVIYSGLEPIKFSNVLLNEGNAYNKDTGMFKAPTDGIYQFNAHICGEKNATQIEYYIKVGSNVIVTGEFEVPERASDTKCTSFSAVALARKGDNVLVGGSYFSELDRENNDLSSFSGVLIRTV